MASRRIIIDGLSRCLCPSIDVAIAQRCIRPNAVFRHRLRKQRATHPSAAFSQIRQSSTATSTTYTTRDEAESKELLASRHIEQDEETDKSTTKFTAQFDKLSTPELHHQLRQCSLQPKSYYKTVAIVEYLLNNRGEKPQVGHYAPLIRANASAEHGSAAVVATLREDMKKAGVTPDAGIYHSMLEALAVHPDYLLRNEVLDELHARWFTLSDEGWHHVVVGLLRDRQYELAVEKLDEMHKQGIKVESWLYDICIYLLCQTDGLDEAVGLLRYRTNNGDVTISPTVWYYVLEACSQAYHYDGTKFVWDYRVRLKYINPPDGLCTNVINIAARHHDLVLAAEATQILVERGSKVDLHHYEGLLEAYAVGRDLENCLRILCLMKRATLEPEPGSTREFVAFLVSEPHLPMAAFETMKRLEAEGQDIPIEAVNAAIESAAILGRAEDALQIYRELRDITPSGPNTTTFDCLLQAVAKAEASSLGASATIGNKQLSVLAIASEMASQYIQPTSSTYEYMILGCIHEGLFQEALMYLEEMETMGFWPRPATLEKIIRSFAASGDRRSETILEMAERKAQRESLRARFRMALAEEKEARSGAQP